MFIVKVHGKEEIATKAECIGLKAGCCQRGGGYGRPGLVGNIFLIKDQLKSAGARWDGAEKAWTFESWDALESAVDRVIAARELAQ